jgi:hypothetical protein
VQIRRIAATAVKTLVIVWGTLAWSLPVATSNMPSNVPSFGAEASSQPCHGHTDASDEHADPAAHTDPTEHPECDHDHCRLCAYTGLSNPPELVWFISSTAVRKLDTGRLSRNVVELHRPRMASQPTRPRAPPYGSA